MNLRKKKKNSLKRKNEDETLQEMNDTIFNI